MTNIIFIIVPQFSHLSFNYANMEQELYLPFPIEIVESILHQLLFVDFNDGFRAINGLNRFTHNSPLRKQIIISGLDMDNAARRGQILLLDWWLKESGYTKSKLPFTNLAFEWAIKENHIHVLEWFRKAKLISDTKCIVDSANLFGRINVLEWLKHNGFSLQYKINPIDLAAVYEYEQVIWWWAYKSGEPLIFKMPTASYVSMLRNKLNTC
jgi:hypothetical protein